MNSCQPYLNKITREHLSLSAIDQSMIESYNIKKRLPPLIQL